VLRPGTGLALIAVGLVLLLAVRVHTASVDLRTTGFILAGTGLTWLWLPVGDKKDLLGRQVQRALRYMCWDPSEPTVRSPLADLLDNAEGPGPRAARRADRDSAPGLLSPPRSDLS
jgi:hypothetical protein